MVTRQVLWFVVVVVERVEAYTARQQVFGFVDDGSGSTSHNNYSVFYRVILSEILMMIGVLFIWIRINQRKS